MISLFPGRFQPLHLGHVKTIHRIEKQGFKVVVGIVRREDRFNNPFPAEKVVEMSKAVLKNQTVIISATLTNPENIVLLRSIEFDVVHSGNLKVLKNVRKFGYKAIRVRRTMGYDSNIIRQMIRLGDSRWKNLLPSPVIPIIENQMKENAMLLHSSMHAMEDLIDARNKLKKL